MRLLTLVLLLTAAASSETLVRVDLTDNWKYFDADSPTFSAPDFDDSAWKSAPSLGTNGTDGVRWWRRKAVVPQDAAGQPLYLTIPKGPAAYRVFVNGTPIGDSGDLKDLSNQTVMQPRTFPVPAGLIQPDGSCLVAIRDENPFFLPPSLGLRTV